MWLSSPFGWSKSWGFANKMFKSKLPTVSQMKDELGRELQDTEVRAKMWEHTRKRHEQLMADYKERTIRKYAMWGQSYDMSTDPNVTYWQDQIDFCEYEVNLLRAKYQRVKELLKGVK